MIEMAAQNTPEDFLLLAAWCYVSLTEDEPPNGMTRDRLAWLVIEHMDAISKAEEPFRRRFWAGDDQALSEFDARHPLLKKKIGISNREAKRLFSNIANVIENTFTKREFSMRLLVQSMQKQGLPVLSNETMAIAEELSDSFRALSNFDAEKERAIQLWNANLKMTKRDLEHVMLGGNHNHLSYFKSIKEYSEQRHGPNHLRKGKSGSPQIDRE